MGQIASILASAEPEIMERVSLLYTSTCQELVKFTSDATTDTLPDRVAEEVRLEMTNLKGSCPSFAKLKAILQDFCLF